MTPTRPLRLVLDTNVLISALIRPAGAPGTLFSRCLREPWLTLVASDAILEEMRRVLCYPKVLKYTRQTKQEANQMVAALAILADVVDGEFPPVVGCEDGDDVIYIQAALVGHADFIVSGDKHLLDMDGYQGLRIITPATALRELSARSRRDL